MELSEAYEGILVAVQEILEANKTALGVETVIRGDRAKPRPPTPCIWIFAENASIDQTQSALREKWRLPIVLASIIKSHDPEEGYVQASKLAAKARSLILKNRTLGLRSYVQDTVSSRYEPSGPWHNDGNLYGAVAVVDVFFLVQE